MDKTNEQTQAVPAGWKLERRSEDRVRVTSPDGEAWSFTDIDDNGGSNQFLYKLFSAMLASAPQAQPDGMPDAWSDAKQAQFNDWFLGLPEGRRAVLIADKWLLAAAAFEAGQAPQAQPVAVEVPDGWQIESGKGWISIRNDRSQLGQDFYFDRDPLIFGFLSAIASSPARADYTRVMQQALDTLEAVEPYADQLTDYSSTVAEWPLNLLPSKVVAAIAALRIAISDVPAQHTQPSQPVREPMSIDAIREAISDAGMDWHNGWTVGEDSENRYLNLCRAIERHHGIGSKGGA